MLERYVVLRGLIVNHVNFEANFKNAKIDGKKSGACSFDEASKERKRLKSEIADKQKKLEKKQDLENKKKKRNKEFNSKDKKELNELSKAEKCIKQDMKKQKEELEKLVKIINEAKRSTMKEGFFEEYKAKKRDLDSKMSSMEELLKKIDENIGKLAEGLAVMCSANREMDEAIQKFDPKTKVEMNDNRVVNEVLRDSERGLKKSKETNPYDLQAQFDILDKMEKIKKEIDKIW
jgi:hypothetical protein